MCWDSLSALSLKFKLWEMLETHPIFLNAGKISPALNQFQSCHDQVWKFNFFAVETSILKMSGTRLLIFWQLTDRLATTGQLTESLVVCSINWGWGELVLDQQVLTTKMKCYKVWQFMWLFPPPCTHCFSASTMRRKSSQNILGRRPALLPTGRAKGNPLRSVPQSLGPNNGSAGKASRKGPWCSLNIYRVTLRWHFTPLCSSSQPPVKVGR